MPGTLNGIRVVDLTTVILGPWAAQTLGDMGADVIKIETPTGDTTRHMGPRKNPGMGSLFMSTNRNKRSIVLDLKTREGRDALLRIVDTADVFMHNMRPKVATKLELTYERFAANNPSLIFCAAYGFRADGPLADSPAYDDIIQAASGIASLQAVVSDQPRFVPTIVADKTTSYNVVSSILAALFCREREGNGQSIEVPMFESLVDNVMIEHLYGAAFEPAAGPMGYARLLNTGRRPYATKDGFLAVLPYSDENWRQMFELAGREDLKGDPRFTTQAARVDNSQEVYDLLGEMIAERTTAEWQEALTDASIPVMSVNSLEDLLDDEQLVASGFWRMEEHPSEGTVRMTDPPIRFSNNPSEIRRMQPKLGQHSRAILAESGFSETEIEALFKAGVSA
ncbi:MAG: CoA transferase [Alphaproteobacteria bacterium]|nr:CoA transferase [Alphaproteobacteria bacterium]